MDCSKTKNLINALADGELKAKQKQEVMDHILICKKCSAEYNEIIKIKQLLNTAPEIKSPSDFLSKLHSRMKEENLIEKKESIFNAIINSINRPVILRPAAAFILSVIIIAVYRPHEFLSENFKISDSAVKSENIKGNSVKKSELQEVKKNKKDIKTFGFFKKENQEKSAEINDSLKPADSKRMMSDVNEKEEDNSAPSPAAEKNVSKKIAEEKDYSVSQKSKLSIGNSSDRKASSAEGYNKKSRVENPGAVKYDKFSKPSGYSIDSVINKYKGKILYRDNNKISISLPYNKSSAFFNEITGLVSKYIITGKKSDLIYIEMFLKKNVRNY